MKTNRYLLPLFFLILLFSFPSSAQVLPQVEGGLIDFEISLSYSDVTNARPRVSATSIIMPIYLHLAYAYDSKYTHSIKTGLTLRNVGLVAKDTTKIKARAFGIGVPVSYIYVHEEGAYYGIGISYELLFHYKHKIFLEDKIIQNKFFSDKINIHQPSIILEYNHPFRIGLKLGYYPFNFFSKDYKIQAKDSYLAPLMISDSRIFYFSIRMPLSDFN